MAKLETPSSPEQILEGMRQLSDEEKRALAATVLSDPTLESFVEELDDCLTCERAANEGPPEPFNLTNFSVKDSTTSTQPAAATSSLPAAAR